MISHQMKACSLTSVSLSTARESWRRQAVDEEQPRSCGLWKTREERQLQAMFDYQPLLWNFPEALISPFLRACDLENLDGSLNITVNRFQTTETSREYGKEVKEV